MIFDEPTNGLDPAGIHEIRATMTDLAEQGKTVLVSSHILAEVQQVADTVSIIGRGKLLAEGEVDDILDDNATKAVRVGVRNAERAAGILTEAGLVTEVSGPDLMIVTSPPGETRPLDPSQINRILTERSLYPFELGMERANLESVFLELTRTEHLGQTQLEATPEGGSR